MSDLIWTPIPGTDLPIVVVVGLIGAWLYLRHRATRLDSESSLDAMIGAGRPVVLQFFKNT